MDTNLLTQISESCRIQTTGNYQPPIPTISFPINGVSFNIGGRGDLSVVTGKPKTRKTFLMGLMAASGLTYNELGERTKPTAGKVLYFDTEQSDYHAVNSLKRIINLAGSEYENSIEYYALRGQSTDMRMEIINHLIYTAKNPSLVFIDGARDLVTSINDEYQASNVVNRFSEWTRSKNMHLVTVLHENPSSEKVRGHLGTELTNKAENVFVVELDKSMESTSIVRTRFSRNLALPSFKFKIDHDGIAKVLEYEVARTFHYNSPEVNSLLSELFSNGIKLGHGQLMEKIKTGLANVGYKIGDNQLKQWINSLLSDGIISKEGKPRSPNAKYFLPK